jgi:putative tricarboxylic transport membrane protein
MRAKEGRSQSFRFPWRAAFAGAFVAAQFCGAAMGAWKPDQNVEIVIPTSPGTGSDTTGRRIQSLLHDKKLVDVSTTVVNKPGGATSIATAYVNQHAGNGHYLMLTTISLLTGHIVGASKATYTDTTPLGQIGTESVAAVVRADSRFKTPRDLANALKADPAAVTVAFANALGNHNHIAAAQVVRSVGANPKQMKTVVFNGSGEAVTALLGGHVDVVTISASPVLKHVSAGKLKILAVSADQRLGGELADVPTWKELGVASVSSNWRCLVGPKGMTQDQITYWDQVIGKLARLPEWREDLEKKLIEPTYLDARDTKKRMDTEYAELSKLLGELGLAKQ